MTDLNNSECGINSSFLSTTENVDFDVKKIIQTDVLGKAIITKYLSQDHLETKDRNIICEILITFFLNNSYKLNNTSLSDIADKLVQLFPTEHKTTYYIAPIPKKKSRLNKPEVARGKLVDKHRNKLTALRRTQFRNINPLPPEIEREGILCSIFLKC